LWTTKFISAGYAQAWENSPVIVCRVVQHQPYLRLRDRAEMPRQLLLRREGMLPITICPCRPQQLSARQHQCRDHLLAWDTVHLGFGFILLGIFVHPTQKQKQQQKPAVHMQSWSACCGLQS